MKNSKLIIGLGNPGALYKSNRHNVGYMFIDKALISKSKVLNNLKVQKTDTFMNESGRCVKKFVKSHEVQTTNLYVVHDDLDIPLGKFKIQFGVGPKVHNGLDSVEQELGTKDFWRVRIGVDNRVSDNRIPGEQYVLQDFASEELEILNDLFPEIWKNLILRLEN